MPDEVNQGFTDIGNFSIETRLIVACYICDENGVEIEDLKDYKEKGRSLKILTEEYEQEIASPKGKKRYTSPRAAELVYWDRNLYYGVDYSSLITARTNDDAILADMQQFAKTTPAVVFSDQTFPASFNKSVNGFENNNVVRRTIFKPSIVTMGDPLAIPPIEPEIIPDSSSPINYTHLHVVERYASNDKFLDSPLFEIDKPDDCRKIGSVSELYAKRCPSIRFSANPTSGLDGAILKLLMDPRLNAYNLESLIIGEHNYAELRKFKPLSAYSIKQETYSKIFKKFKKIEINNPMITVVFPSGEFEADSIKLKNCTILVNNSTIKSKSPINIENCKFANNNPKTGPKHLILNTSNSINIKTVTILEPVKLSFISETNDINLSIDSLIYDCDVTNSGIKGAMVNVVKFTELNITGITKTDKAILSSTPLMGITDCITVKINEIVVSPESFSGNLFNISGFNEVVFDNVNGSPSSTGSLCSISNSGLEGSVKFSNIKTSFNKLCTLVKCTLGSFSIDGSEITLNKFVSVLNTSILSVKCNTSIITFKEDNSFDFPTLAFDSSTINGTNLNIKTENTLTLSKSSIACTNLSINLNNTSKLSTTEASFTIKDKFEIIGKNKDDIASKVDFVKSTLEGEMCTIDIVDSISCNYAFIMVKNFIVSNCKVFDSTDSTVRINKVDLMSFTAVTDMKKSAFLIEDGGSLSVNTDKCIGKLIFTINADAKINRKSVNSRTGETFINKDKKLSLAINTSGCKSSAFIAERKSISISPLSDDFKLFKSTPAKFEISTAGKELFEDIYYGPIL